MWIVIVQKYNLSYIAPMATGLSQVLIIAASIFILGEKIGTFQWMGIALVLGGVVLMNIKG
jgi:drug/metabolite transporter (DMT)-like permease